MVVLAEPEEVAVANVSVDPAFVLHELVGRDLLQDVTGDLSRYAEPRIVTVVSCLYEFVDGSEHPLLVEPTVREVHVTRLSQGQLAGVAHLLNGDARGGHRLPHLRLRVVADGVYDTVSPFESPLHEGESDGELLLSRVVEKAVVVVGLAVVL